MLALALAAAACGALRARQTGPIRNVVGCRPAIYETKPLEISSMIVANGRLFWSVYTSGTITSAPIGGGATKAIRPSAAVGSVESMIVAGEDLVFTSKGDDALHRVPLAGGRVTRLVGDIRHPQVVVFARGKYFIGGEDGFYRFNPARDDLSLLFGGVGVHAVDVRDGIVYAIINDHLVAMAADTEVQTILSPSVATPSGGQDLDDIGVLAATPRGPVWSMRQGGLWLYELATKQIRQLAQLDEMATQILPVGSDLYLTVGATVRRLRGNRVVTVPLDTRGWDPRARVWSIAVDRDSLYYAVAFETLSSICLSTLSSL